jgi:hypothetical protein
MLGVSIGSDRTIFPFIFMPTLEHPWNLVLNPKLRTNL